MTAILRHVRIRLATISRRPLQVALLVFCGLCSVLFWPSLTDASGSGWMGGDILDYQGPAFSSVIMIMYLIGLPMVAIGAVRGSAAHFTRRTAWAIQAHPTLPISSRARAVAEALAALAPIVLVRSLAFTTGLVPQRFWLGLEDSSSAGKWLLESTVVGGLVMVLFLLVAGSSSDSIENHWLRLLAAAGAIFGALKTGLLESLVTAIPTTLTLAALALFFLIGNGHDRRRLSERLAALSPAARGGLARKALAPERQFHRDLWVRPLPAAAVLVGAEVVFVTADRLVGFPQLLFFFASVLVVAWLVAFVTLQPMRSRLAVAGTLGKPGFRPGDLYAALSVLPLRRHVIGRGVFVYGLVTSFAIWSFAVGLIVLSAWLETGHAVLVDSDGDSLTRLAVLMTTFVPALTGLLTCAVFGNKRGAALNGAVVLAYPPIGTVFLLGSASSLTCAVVVAILWLVCVAPALRYLRRDPSAGPIVSGAPTLTPPAAR